jgi:VanZ family protein
VSGRPWPILLPLAWMAVILWFSTPEFSAERTRGWLLTVLAWLAPGLSAEATRTLHRALRSVAHVAEYGVLAALWLRAVARIPAPTAVTAGCVLVLCAAWAAVDETRQAAVPSRRGSAWDIALDTAGAALALAAILALRRPADRGGPDGRARAVRAPSDG